MLFKKTKSLEEKFNKFLNLTSESAMIFFEGVKCYLHKENEEFENYLAKLIKLEQTADALRREIETVLYEKTLLPEARGDIFELLEDLDDVINQTEETLLEFSIEIPQIPEKYNEHFTKLTEYSINAVNQVVKASRKFVQDPANVEHNIHKVYFWEKEADRQSEKLKREIFRDESIDKVSRRFHLRYFALHIDMVADLAEDVADKLTIYAIKRSI